MSGVVFVTHDLPVLSQVSDQLAIMNAGRIVETGPTRQLVEEPQHDYTRTLLSSVLDPSEETRRRGRARRRAEGTAGRETPGHDPSGRGTTGQDAPTRDEEVGTR